LKKKLLIFGGEGYIGRVVQDELNLKNYKCVSFDNLIYEKNKKNYLKKNKDRQIIFGNIKDVKKIEKLLKDFDLVLILAGLVGDPITKSYPLLSKKINENYIKKLINTCLASNIERLIFVSTCSNYGISKNNKRLKENAPLRPISLYARSKVRIEKFILSKKNKTQKICTILRFATAFGSSPRMRFDLTLNEFVKTMFDNKILEIYDKDTWRPYCHVKDFAKIIDKVFQAAKRKVFFEVFNAGSSKNNFTKLMIVQKIKKFFKNRKKIKFVDNSKDMRNYEVNFDKIKRKLNFISNWTLEKGIREIALKLNKKKYPKSSNGNYKIYN
jgi:nucleoside-diphosphate-sugar epimerase